MRRERVTQGVKRHMLFNPRFFDSRLYIRTLVADAIEELYDLKADPEELQNLAVKADFHELLAEFRKLLIAELRRTDSGMVDNLPPVRVMTASGTAAFFRNGK